MINTIYQKIKPFLMVFGNLQLVALDIAFFIASIIFIMAYGYLLFIDKFIFQSIIALLCAIHILMLFIERLKEYFKDGFSFKN